MPPTPLYCFSAEIQKIYWIFLCCFTDAGITLRDERQTYS